jgi:hypothetical protein
MSSLEGPSSGPGPHPLVGRQRHLIVALRWSLAITGILALAGVVLAGRAGEIAATMFLVVLIAIPIIRVIWLGIRWVRRGDPRYALVSGVLLVVIATAVAVGW